MILRDGNRTIYPLAKDCTSGIRDPQWLDLPPARAMSMSTQTLSHVAPGCKNKVSLVSQCDDMFAFVLLRYHS